MKKILSVILLSVILLLVACEPIPNQEIKDVHFEVPESFEHTIGDTVYDYLLDIKAQTNTGINLKPFIIIDDLSVNYASKGIYQMYVTLIYLEITYQETVIITVKEAVIIDDRTITFDVIDHFTYTINEDKPNYIAGVTAKYSDNQSLINYVSYDDSFVNYELPGTYDIIFKLDGFDNIEVVIRQVQVIEQKMPQNMNLNIFYINDFHGAILNSDDQMGLASIGHLIMDEKTKNPDTTLFISGGDILQGQLISNWYDGASTIELLNDMELDAFVVGNHEFDWGIDVLTQYFDGTSHLQANFPLLGANVYKKETNQIADGFKPYTIIEKSGVKVAVIGTMGYGLESSIAYARIKDHKFIDPIERTGYFAELARIKDGADIVIAVNHMDDDNFNDTVARFSGNKKVDAIFNGHTHQRYTRTIQNTPIIQSGANGSYVGQVTLNYSTTNGVYGYSHKNLNRSNEVRLNHKNQDIEDKINLFYDEISGLYEPIMISEQSVDRSTLATYIGQLMQSKYGADVGLHNYGGTRDSISYNEDLSYAKLHAISPFDNSVVLVEVTGTELLNAIGTENAYFRPGLNKSSIVANAKYKLALNDYIFGSKSYLRDKEATFTGVTVLDLFVETVENQSKLYDKWSPTLPLIFDTPVSIFTHLFAFSMQINT